MAKYEVRLVEPKDFPWCAEVAAIRMLTEEVGRPDFVDVPSLYLILNKMYADKSGIVALVDGEYAGAIGGYLHPSIFNPEIAVMAELIWYVLPEYRQSRVGAMLLKAFDEMTEASPAHEATLSLLNTSPIKHSSLEKKGFTVSEQAFRKIYKEN